MGCSLFFCLKSRCYAMPDSPETPLPRGRPKKEQNRSIVRGFRMPAQTLNKLDALATQTGRTRASMLIYLIAVAEPTHLPNIRLGAEPVRPLEGLPA